MVAALVLVVLPKGLSSPLKGTFEICSLTSYIQHVWRASGQPEVDPCRGPVLQEVRERDQRREGDSRSTNHHRHHHLLFFQAASVPVTVTGIYQLLTLLQAIV